MAPFLLFKYETVKEDRNKKEIRSAVILYCKWLTLKNFNEFSRKQEKMLCLSDAPSIDKQGNDEEYVYLPL